MNLSALSTEDLLAELKRRRKLAVARLGAGPLVAGPRHLRSRVPLVRTQGRDALAGCAKLCSRLIRIAAEEYGVTSEDVAMLKGRSPRAQRVAEARWLVCHVLHLAGWSFPMLGEAFHHDHTSVLKGSGRIAALLEAGDNLLAATVFEKLCTAVEGQ